MQPIFLTTRILFWSIFICYSFGFVSGGIKSNVQKKVTLKATHPLQASTSLNLSLRDDEVVTFKSFDIPRTGINNPNHWTENNERSTSANYTLWKKSDVYLIEWPGNITELDPKWPLLKWTHKRAKYRENYCCQSWVGIEMRAYAYRYLYLTWGPYRLTQTFSPPLTVNASIFDSIPFSRRYAVENRTEILISDFGFVQDALIIAAPEAGVVILVSNLEMTFARVGELESYEPLHYNLAKGITSPVDKIITQYCCVKSDMEICPHGETIVAYREHSQGTEFTIFISYDGGKHFKTLKPKVSGSSTTKILHSVLAYPDVGKLFLIHGTKKTAIVEAFSSETGVKISLSKRNDVERIENVKGYLQSERIGEELSFVMWDECNAWYSLAEGKNLTKAIFYVHGWLQGQREEPWNHFILSHYCKFGRESSFAMSPHGKFALLDSENRFHLGVDSKMNSFQLVTLYVDMSLILKRHQSSVVPHFDHSQHPKLLYPPRFLEVPDKQMLGANYSQRLAVRVLPKTVLPSEFITVFYQENAWLPKKYKGFALPPCQTSSISVNRSISQKPKVYTMKPLQHLNFTVHFKSRYNSTKQLNYEPKEVNKYLQIRVRLISIAETEPEDAQFWFNYEVVITSRSLSIRRRIFMINFFTFKTLRCNIQPSSPVYIKIDDNSNPSVGSLDEDYHMSVGSFLKAENMQTEYGTKYIAPTCSQDQKDSNSKEKSCDANSKPPKVSAFDIQEALLQQFGPNVHIQKRPINHAS